MFHVDHWFCYALRMNPTTIEHESSILERLVISAESARAILSIRFAPEDEERMRELMEKNNCGALSEVERAQMEAFRRVGSFLAIAQAKARLQLDNDRRRGSNGP